MKPGSFTAVTVGVLLSAAFVAWVWYLARPSSDDGTGCVYSFVAPNTDDLARRMMARAQLLMKRDSSNLLIDHDDWWRRAKFMPTTGIAQCPGFRMTIKYAVDHATDREQIDGEGDQEAYKRWRDTLAKRSRRSDPLWVDVRRWERQ